MREQTSGGTMSEHSPEQEQQAPVSKSDRFYRLAHGDPRPKPDFTMDPLHRGLVLLSAVTVLVMTALVALRVPEMPKQIPVHLSISGEVNRYGSPWTSLWVTAGLAVLVLGTAWISFKPHWFNYPYRIEPANAQRVYRVGQQLMVQIAALMAAATFGSAASWLGWGMFWLVPVSAAGLLMVTVIHIIRTFRAR